MGRESKRWRIGDGGRRREDGVSVCALLPVSSLLLMDRHFQVLEGMYAAAAINQFFRPSIHVSEGAAEIRMAVRPDMHHAVGAAHGAVYFKMLDDAAFFAAQSLVTDVFVLTASFT